MTKIALPFLLLAVLAGGCAPLSGRYPQGIPAEMISQYANNPQRGGQFRANLREWLGPPPTPAEEATIRPPPTPAEEATIRPPHSQFHPVPIRPVFGADTSPLAPQFPTLRPKVQQPESKPRHVESKTPAPQAMKKEEPKPLAKPVQKPASKKAPARIQEAGFQLEQPAAATSTLPKFRRLRR